MIQSFTTEIPWVAQSETSCIHTTPCTHNKNTTNRQGAHAGTDGTSDSNGSSKFCILQLLWQCWLPVASLLGCHGHFSSGNISSYPPPTTTPTLPTLSLSGSLYVRHPWGCMSHRFVRKPLTLSLWVHVFIYRPVHTHIRRCAHTNEPDKKPLWTWWHTCVKTKIAHCGIKEDNNNRR